MLTRGNPIQKACPRASYAGAVFAPASQALPFPRSSGTDVYLLVHFVFIHVANSLTQVLDMKLKDKNVDIQTSIQEKPLAPYNERPFPSQ